jgi:hypothetical protein
MHWKPIAIDLLLLVISLALGLGLHGSDAEIVLFSIAGLLVAALVAGGIWNSNWFWRLVAARVGPQLVMGSSSAETAPAATDEEVASAIDDLLDELATIDSRLREAIDAEFYGYKFFLPSNAYTANRKVISARSSEARKALSEVYVAADELNRKMPGQTEDGIEMAHVSSPDAVWLRETVARAQILLRNIRA